MATAQMHIEQARHNGQLANYLLANPTPTSFFDWSVVAGFYAAIHYVEGYFYFQPHINHAEDSIPVGTDNKKMFSPHTWREKLIERELDRSIWKAYRQLRTASESIRYLNEIGATIKGAGPPSQRLIDKHNATLLITMDLATIRTYKRFDLIEAIVDLEIAAGSELSRAISNKVIRGYKNGQQFRTDPTIAKGFLAAQEFEELNRFMLAANCWKPK